MIVIFIIKGRNYFIFANIFHIINFLFVLIQNMVNIYVLNKLNKSNMLKKRYVYIIFSSAN